MLVLVLELMMRETEPGKKRGGEPLWYVLKCKYVLKDLAGERGECDRNRDNKLSLAGQGLLEANLQLTFNVTIKI